MPADPFEIELIEVEQLTPTVRGFRFAPGTSLDTFTPGQFVMLHFELDGAEVKRSYSLAQLPGSGGPFLAVAPVDGGRATRYFWERQAGDRVTLSGPYGRFCLRESDAPARLILVATGTGLSPYRTMIPELVARAAEGLEVVVLLGVRTRDEALFRADFDAAAGVDFRVCLSREAEVGEGERAGYVTAELRALDPDPDRDLVYLCGNPQMVDDSVELLQERGFSLRSIRREKYI